MVVGHVPEAVDFVVAGAGPGGYAAALHAAQSGRQVLLIDSAGEAGIGGVCLHTGCIPSKTLIEVAGLKARVETQSMGLNVATARFDAREFQVEKHQVIDRLTAGVRSLLNNAGVEVLAGTLSVSDSKSAVINLNDGNVKFLSFKSLVLATGSSTIALDALPFDGDSVLDSSDVLALDVLPSSIAVVGAGYIGVELGMALAKLGVKVHLLDTEDRLLPAMDPSVSTAVANRLGAFSIEFQARSRAVAFEPGRLEVESAAGERSFIAADKVLVAVGRRPNSTGIGIEELGVAIDSRGVVAVAEDLRISPRIAAIGDLTPGAALAHKATAQAGVAVAALGGKQTAFDAVIPEVVFCDPEVAVVGLTQANAREQGLDANIARFPWSASGRAATLGSRDGFTQVVFDRDDGAVLGVQMVGPHASELIAEAVLAIEMGAGIEDLSLTMHPHPTLSETLNEAAQLAMGCPLHVASVASSSR